MVQNLEHTFAAIYALESRYKPVKIPGRWYKHLSRNSILEHCVLPTHTGVVISCYTTSNEQLRTGHTSLMSQVSGGANHK